MTNETGFTAFFARLPLFAARIISLAVMLLGIAVLWSVWFFYEERWRHGELISYYGIQPLLMIGGGTLAFISGCLMMTRSLRGIQLLKLALRHHSAYSGATIDHPDRQGDRVRGELDRRSCRRVHGRIDSDSDWRH